MCSRSPALLQRALSCSFVLVVGLEWQDEYVLDTFLAELLDDRSSVAAGGYAIYASTHGETVETLSVSPLEKKMKERKLKENMRQSAKQKKK